MKKLSFSLSLAGAMLALTSAGTAFASAEEIRPTGTIGGLDFNEVVSFVVNTGLNILFLIAGIAALVYIVWAGIQYITSNGDTKKAESARNAVINGIIGLAIIAGAYFLINLGLGIGNTVNEAQPEGGITFDLNGE